jgi:hypothetical protein
MCDKALAFHYLAIATADPKEWDEGFESVCDNPCRSSKTRALEARTSPTLIEQMAATLQSTPRAGLGLVRYMRREVENPEIRKSFPATGRFVIYDGEAYVDVVNARRIECERDVFNDVQ